MINIDNNWLEEQVITSGNSTFIKTDKENFTFEEIGQKAGSLAMHLQNMGVGKGERVAVMSGNKLEIFLASLALWQNNNIPVVINLLWSLEQINDLLEELKIKRLVVQTELRDVVNRLSDNVTRIHFDAPDISENIEKQNDFSIDNKALILFTSGSTSKPKSIIFSFNNLYNSFKNMTGEYPHCEEDTWLASLPLYHIGGFQIFVRSLLSGCSIFIPEKTDHDSMKSCLNAQPITYASFVSTQFKKLIDSKIESPKALKKVFLGGGPIDTELINKATELSWSVVKVYGATETSSMVTSVDVTENPEKIESAGKPFQNVEITIAEKSENESGEIVIKSDSIAEGCLIDNKFFSISQNGLLCSGDLGYLDEDGFLYITGRSKRIIISGGENVSALEVEKAINQHPDIVESFVFAEKDDKWGEIPAAVVVFKTTARIDFETVKSFLKERLPTYKCPKQLNVIFELPKNEMGKIDIVQLMRIVRPD